MGSPPNVCGSTVGGARKHNVTRLVPPRADSYAIAIPVVPAPTTTTSLPRQGPGS